MIIYNSHNLTTKERFNYLINNIKVYYYMFILIVVYPILNLLLYNKFTKPKNIYQAYCRGDIYIFIRNLLCFKGYYPPFPKDKYRCPYVFGWVTKDNPERIQFDNPNAIDGIDYNKELEPIDIGKIFNTLKSSLIILR